MIYYSDKYSNDDGELLPQAVWAGILALINRSIINGSFGESFPDNCPDGNYVCGTNTAIFNDTLQAHIPDVILPFDSGTSPQLLIFFDLIEFSHFHISKPRIISRHSYYNHNHYSYDRDEGQSDFRDEINTIFRRNSLEYLINDDGEIARLLPEEISELFSFNLSTGDAVLDQFLIEAKKKILHPNIEERLIAVEKIWDAWERVKTIEEGNNKRDTTKAILDKAASEPTYRELLENEARTMTDLGNSFRIRHSEVGKIEIERESQIDYFFYRLYSLIYLLLRERSDNH